MNTLVNMNMHSPTDRATDTGGALGQLCRAEESLEA